MSFARSFTWLRPPARTSARYLYRNEDDPGTSLRHLAYFRGVFEGFAVTVLERMFFKVGRDQINRAGAQCVLHFAEGRSTPLE